MNDLKRYAIERDLGLHIIFQHMEKIRHIQPTIKGLLSESSLGRGSFTVII